MKITIEIDVISMELVTVTKVSNHSSDDYYNLLQKKKRVNPDEVENQRDEDDS